MKTKTIAALARKLTSGLKEDGWRRTRLLEAAGRTGKALDPKQGPRITAAELARLVDARMRQKGVLAKDSAEAMMEEIEATLDLVEACEVMLVNRQEQWKTSVSWLKQAIADAGDKPSEIVKGIRAASYPMKFETGLIRIGVPERGREDKFWRCFQEWLLKVNHREASNGQSLSEYIESRPFTDDEIREVFMKCKAEGWQNARHLEVAERGWREWWAKHKHDGQKMGGKRSVEARAKKKSKVKVQPAPPVKR